MRQLAAMGLLSDTASTPPTAAGVELFVRDFVTPAELAGMSGMDVRTMHGLVEAAGVDRALGPPNRRQFFYRRRDPRLPTGTSGCIVALRPDRPLPHLQ